MSVVTDAYAPAIAEIDKKIESLRMLRENLVKFSSGGFDSPLAGFAQKLTTADMPKVTTELVSTGLRKLRDTTITVEHVAEVLRLSPLTIAELTAALQPKFPQRTALSIVQSVGFVLRQNPTHFRRIAHSKLAPWALKTDGDPMFGLAWESPISFDFIHELLSVRPLRMKRILDAVHAHLKKIGKPASESVVYYEVKEILERNPKFRQVGTSPSAAWTLSVTQAKKSQKFTLKVDEGDSDYVAFQKKLVRDAVDGCGIPRHLIERPFPKKSMCALANTMRIPELIIENPQPTFTPPPKPLPARKPAPAPIALSEADKIQIAATEAVLDDLRVKLRKRNLTSTEERKLMDEFEKATERIERLKRGGKS